MMNVAMPVHLHGIPIWTDNINIREYRRTKMVLEAVLGLSMPVALFPQRQLQISTREHTALYIGSNRRVEKHYWSGMMKGKSHSVNGRNSSLIAQNENGPIC